MLIKYIKSVLLGVAKRLSYIEEARCLKVKNLELRCHVSKKSCQKTASVRVPVGGRVQREPVVFIAAFNSILLSQEEESVVEDESCSGPLRRGMWAARRGPF